MKKLLMIAAAAILVCGAYGTTITSAIAKDTDDHAEQNEERIDHYAGAEIKTNEQALETLNAKNAEIAQILKSEKLEGAQLEKIHEISYTLENSIDELIGEKADDADKLATVDEAVQAVHHASENHEEDKVREWFPKLEAGVAAIDLAIDLDSESKEASNNDGVYNIIIKDHKFTPDEIRVPADKKIKLIVENQDSTPEEFESDDFRREKIIAGNSKATIFVGPLKPGKYHFFGEFNLDSANGYLIAE